MRSGYSCFGVTPPLRRKIAKVVAYALGGLVALLGTVVLGAILFVQGERLAKIVNGVLPEMKGSLHFKAIRWKPRLLFDLVTDRPTPMTVDGLLITDPEGTTVLDVPHLEVAVKLKTLIAGGGIILSDLKVGPQSVWRFSKMTKLKGIGFLDAFDPKHPSPPPPPPPPGAKKEKGFVFQIANAELNGFRAIFDFPGVWGLDLRDIHAPASVLVDGEGFVGWDIVGLEARQGGYLMVMDQVLPFDSVLVDRVATTREWSDDIFLDLRQAKTGRSELMGKGFFTGIYGAHSVGGIKIHAEFAHAADALTAVAKPHNITGLRLSGDNAKVVGDLWDPYDTMKIKAAISGLDVGYESYEAQQLALRAGITFATTAPTMTIKVDELSFGSPSGGRFLTEMTMAADDITAKLAFDHFGTEGYLPKGLKKLAAGKVHGHLGIAANIGDKKSVRLSDLDLRYDRSFPMDAIPESVRITGQAQASAESVSTSGLHIAVPGANADIRGKVELAKKVVDVGLRVGVSDLPKVLSTMKVGAAGQERGLGDRRDRHHGSAECNRQLRCQGHRRRQYRHSRHRRARKQIQSARRHVDRRVAARGIAHGALDGGGSAKLFEKSITTMLAAPVLDFHLNGKQLSLQELIASGVVSGQVSFALTATGTAQKPKVHFQVPAGATVEVLGQPWLLRGIDIEADKESLVVRLCHVAAKAGGDIQIEGRINLASKPLGIDWSIKILDLPLAAILAAAKVDAPVSGLLSINLHVAGSVEKPTVDGAITLAHVRAFGIDLGNATLALSPTPDGGVAVRGNLFKFLDLDATAAATAPRGSKPRHCFPSRTFTRKTCFLSSRRKALPPRCRAR
jgi:hypothetical protein